MDPKCIKCFLFLLFFIKVNSFNFRSQVKTRYRPCGLGTVYFDKITELIWEATLKIELDSKPEIDIYFAEAVRIFGAYNTTSFTIVENNDRHFKIQTQGKPPPIYNFYLELTNKILGNEDTPIVTELFVNSIPLCNDAIKASHTIGSFNLKEKCPCAPAHINEYECGRKSLAHTELITVGTDAKAGDWPWHFAVLYKEKTDSTEYFHGGTIVSRTAVITIGQWLFKDGKIAERIRVIAGTNDFNDVKQIGRQELNATKVVVYPSCDKKTLTACLVIIKVTSFVFTEFVQPICISGPDFDKAQLFGREAMIVGFAISARNTRILRVAKTVIQNDTTCINLEPNLYKQYLSENNYCVGYGPKSIISLDASFTSISTERGSGGGALAVNAIQADNKISWFLRGVSHSCLNYTNQTVCNPVYYTVYTDVAPYYDWIEYHAGSGLW